MKLPIKSSAGILLLSAVVLSGGCTSQKNMSGITGLYSTILRSQPENIEQYPSHNIGLRVGTRYNNAWKKSENLESDNYADRKWDNPVDKTLANIVVESGITGFHHIPIGNLAIDWSLIWDIVASMHDPNALAEHAQFDELGSRNVLRNSVVQAVRDQLSSHMTEEELQAVIGLLPSGGGTGGGGAPIGFVGK